MQRHGVAGKGLVNREEANLRGGPPSTLNLICTDPEHC